MAGAAVFLNGELGCDDSVIRSLVSECGYVACADGGALHALRLGIVPSVVLGDMDSLDGGTIRKLESLKVPVRTFPADKDFSDAELLFGFLRDKGYDQIIVFGALGGRLDHQLGNLLLLEKFLDQGVSIRIEGSGSSVECVKREKRIMGRKGSTVSLFSLTDSSVVTLEGFKFPLLSAVVERGSTLGLSNIVNDDIASVRVSSGAIIVVLNEGDHL